MLVTVTMATATVPVEPTPSAWWLAPIMAILGITFGGGGVAAIMKARYDRVAGVASQEVMEDDAISARWQSIIESQTKSLVEPLKERLATVEADVRRLESELTMQRTKYWRSVAYIRMILTLWKQHLPHKEFPPVPIEIQEDI